MERRSQTKLLHAHRTNKAACYSKPLFWMVAAIFRKCSPFNTVMHLAEAPPVKAFSHVPWKRKKTALARMALKEAPKAVKGARCKATARLRFRPVPFWRQFAIFGYFLPRHRAGLKL